MINKETYTIDWIFNLKNKLGKQVDAKLIEKVIWALTLLEQLQLNGLNFTFKGGGFDFRYSLRFWKYSHSLPLYETKTNRI